MTLPEKLANDIDAIAARPTTDRPPPWVIRTFRALLERELYDLPEPEVMAAHTYILARWDRLNHMGWDRGDFEVRIDGEYRTADHRHHMEWRYAFDMLRASMGLEKCRESKKFARQMPPTQEPKQ
jgi:hypothetical protein